MPALNHFRIMRMMRYGVKSSRSGRGTAMSVYPISGHARRHSGSVWGSHEQRSHPRCKLLRLAWMIRRGIEQALMQAKHIVTGPLGRKIVDRAPSLP